jgi:glucosamine--fructose-6-phosphate aminotransferase (isomerizing)
MRENCRRCRFTTAAASASPAPAERQLFAFADVDSRITSGDGLQVIRLPEHYGLLSPILHVAALQLLAHHTALARVTDVGKPRNLAKSVTVE